MTSTMDTSQLGYLAENIAGRYLQSKGYEIIDRNYRRPWGEIDIVARKDGVIVFIEVKANRRLFTSDFRPEVRVNPEKVRKIIKTAALYLKHDLGGKDCEWQVDVISITFDPSAQKAKLNHFKNVAADVS